MFLLTIYIITSPLHRESLGLQGDQTSQSWRKSVLNIHWWDWCWSWSSNSLTTWCKELTHWERPWCWEGLKAGREGDNRGQDGWMASLTRWTWVWASSGIGNGQKPGILQSMGLQGVGTWLSDWTDWSSGEKKQQWDCIERRQSMEPDSPGLEPWLLLTSYVTLNR